MYKSNNSPHFTPTHAAGLDPSEFSLRFTEALVWNELG